jgi:hypothetical protein
MLILFNYGELPNFGYNLLILLLRKQTSFSYEMSMIVNHQSE